MFSVQCTVRRTHGVAEARAPLPRAVRMLGAVRCKNKIIITFDNPIALPECDLTYQTGNRR